MKNSPIIPLLVCGLLVSTSSFSDSGISGNSLPLNDEFTPIEDILQRFYSEEPDPRLIEIGDADGDEKQVKLQCPESDSENQAKLRLRFIDKLSEDARILEKYANEYDRKARDLFRHARLLDDLEVSSKQTWERGKFYWDWSAEFYDMARKRRHEIERQWYEIAEDYENAGDDHEAAGRNNEAEKCYVRAASYEDPFSLKPWLIPLLGKDDGLWLEERARRHQRAMANLEKAAKQARDSGSKERAEKYEKQIRQHAEFAAEDLENAADFYENELELPDEAEELRQKGRSLKKRAKPGE